jgi:hypothetical protein
MPCCNQRHDVSHCRFLASQIVATAQVPCLNWCDIIIAVHRSRAWSAFKRLALFELLAASLHPLQTLLCAAFCAPEAVVSGLLSVARDQRMLVPIGALRRMLLAIACLGHLQQRPGSDLPQLRAGVLLWVISPGMIVASLLRKSWR